MKSEWIAKLAGVPWPSDMQANLRVLAPLLGGGGSIANVENVEQAACERDGEAVVSGVHEVGERIARSWLREGPRNGLCSPRNR
jgi:hypothetical protein